MNVRRGGVGIYQLAASLLFDHRVNFVTILHVQLVGSVVGLDTITIVQETHGVERNTETIAIGVHQLAELSGLLDLEKDLVAVSALNLKVKMLLFGGLSFSVRHCVD